MNHRLVLFVITTLLLASLGCKDYSVISVDSSSRKVDRGIVTDSTAEEMILAYRIGIDSLMNRQINYAPKALEKGSPEGTLGNYLTDLTYVIAQNWLDKSDIKKNLDFVMLNNGGIRAPIDSGVVTVGDVYAVMPFENEITLLELSGAKMVQLIDYVNAKSLFIGRKGGVPLSSQFNMKIDTLNGKTNTSINGRPFDSRQTYLVATSNYLANGGDDMKFFLNPLKSVDTGIKLRDAFIEGIESHKREGQNVDAKLDGRISFEK